MSLFGAMRMAVVGWTRPLSSRAEEPLAPIRPGAWKDWARSGVSAWAVDGEVGAPCRTADGRAGRVVNAHDGERWVRACEPA
jgi:hypothetical protein